MEIRTFDHLAGRDGIRGTLQVAGCVIEQEKALGMAICFALENVDCMFDLVHERLRIEVAIAVLAWFEHNAGLSEGRLAESMKRYLKKKKKPVVVTQASPLGCQKVRDHKRLPLAFRFGGWSTVL